MIKRKVYRKEFHPHMEYLRNQIENTQPYDNSLYQMGACAENYINFFTFKEKQEFLGIYYAYIFTAFISERESYFGLLLSHMELYFMEKNHEISKRLDFCLKIITIMIENLLVLDETNFILNYYHSPCVKDKLNQFHIEIIFKFHDMFKNYFGIFFKNKIFNTFKWAILEYRLDIITVIIDNHLLLLKENYNKKILLSTDFSRKAFNERNIISKISANFSEFFCLFKRFSCQLKNSVDANFLVFTGCEYIVDIINISDPENLTAFMINFPLEEYFNKNFKFSYGYFRLFRYYAKEDFVLDYVKFEECIRKTSSKIINENIDMIISLINCNHRTEYETKNLLNLLASKNVNIF